MKASERQTRIEAIVKSDGSISVAELKRQFPDISEMTLRRDLDSLDRAGRIIRIHGGARALDCSVGREKSYAFRAERHMDSKQTIARKALSLIRPNTCIFIDSGTTATELCRVLPPEHYLIYTSGLTCAMELKGSERAEVYLLGGRLNAESMATYGSAAVDSIKNIHFDMAFIGSTGFDTALGFTCNNAEDAKLKSEAIRRAEKSIVLMDSAKLGVISTYTFAMPEDIDIIVCESELSADIARELGSHGTKLL